MSTTSDDGTKRNDADAAAVPAKRGHALRDRLIASGLALVERSGPQGLSLREVARESGVSHMAPYGFFRSKNQLLSAIAAAGFHLFRERATRVSQSAGESPRKQIVAGMMAYVRFAQERPQLLRLMFGGQIPVAERCEELRAAYGQSFRYFTTVMSAAIHRGEFRAGEPSEMAFAAWSLVHGFMQLVLSQEFEAKLGGGAGDVEATARRAIDLLLQGLEC